MASSSSDFDEVLAYALRCVQQESLTLTMSIKCQTPVWRKGRFCVVSYRVCQVYCDRLQAWQDQRSSCRQKRCSCRLSPACVSHAWLTNSILLFHFSVTVFSFKGNRHLRYVLRYSLLSLWTRPHTMYLRPLFLPSVLLEKKRPGDEATQHPANSYTRPLTIALTPAHSPCPSCLPTHHGPHTCPLTIALTPSG